MAVNLNITSTVKMLLNQFPETRDNDDVLIVKVWAEEHPEIKVKGYLLKDFTLAFKAGKFSSTETIRRTRQKLQEEFESLRGDSYAKRQKKQSKIKEQLTEPEMYPGGTP